MRFVPGRAIAWVSITLSAGLVTGAVVLAGPLNPPGGAVTGTYKTLSEVEPRIAINATNTPGDANSLFKITQPGSYYLTGNITGVTGKHGIEIAVDLIGPGVSIDLMGFELVGVPGSLDGITVSLFNTMNISIRNGVVRNWGVRGVDINNSQNCRLADLHAASNGGVGIATGVSCSMSGCTTNGNGFGGFSVGAHSTVVDCTAKDNAGTGFILNDSVSLSRCAASDNTGPGIFALESCLIQGCTSVGNDAEGINAGPSSSVRDCTAISNGSASLGGIAIGRAGTVTGCTSSTNRGNGISIVGENAHVTHNVCSRNGVSSDGSGIRTITNSARIEGNTVSGNDAGIFLEPSVTGNFVVGNYAQGNTTNYVNPASGNFIGTPVGTNAAMNSAANSLINISF